VGGGSKLTPTGRRTLVASVRCLPLHQRLLAGLIAFEVMLMVVYAIYPSLGSSSRRIGDAFFDLDEEGNIPSWFSSAQLLSIGVLMWCVASLQAAGGRPSRLSLFVIGGCFVFFSMDEAIVIHERLKTYFEGDDNYRAWMMIYVVIGAAIFLATRRDVLATWHLYRRPALLMIAALGLVVLGGLGLEIVDVEVTDPHPEKTFLNRSAVMLEEWLEMLGATIILYAVILMAQQKFRVTRRRSREGG
jgi:hypothetical protein